MCKTYCSLWVMVPFSDGWLEIWKSWSCLSIAGIPLGVHNRDFASANQSSTVMNLMKCVWRKSQSHNSLHKKLRRIHTFQHFPFSLNIEFGQKQQRWRIRQALPSMGPVHAGKVMVLPQTDSDGSFTAHLQEGLKDNKDKKIYITICINSKEWRSNHVVFPRF